MDEKFVSMLKGNLYQVCNCNKLKWISEVLNKYGGCNIPKVNVYLQMVVPSDNQ